MLKNISIHDPVSHILSDLHWLPVRQRITFKLCVLTYKCLHGMASPYLSEVSCADIVASQSSTAALIFDEFTYRTTDSHMLQRQGHHCSQSGSMERSTG